MKFGNSYKRLQRNDDDLAAFQQMFHELETYSESLDQHLVKNECSLWISEKLNRKVELEKELATAVSKKPDKKTRKGLKRSNTLYDNVPGAYVNRCNIVENLITFDSDDDEEDAYSCSFISSISSLNNIDSSDSDRFSFSLISTIDMDEFDRIYTIDPLKPKDRRKYSSYDTLNSSVSEYSSVFSSAQDVHTQSSMYLNKMKHENSKQYFDFSKIFESGSMKNVDNYNRRRDYNNNNEIYVNIDEEDFFKRDSSLGNVAASTSSLIFKANELEIQPPLFSNTLPRAQNGHSASYKFDYTQSCPNTLLKKNSSKHRAQCQSDGGVDTSQWSVDLTSGLSIQSRVSAEDGSSTFLYHPFYNECMVLLRKRREKKPENRHPIRTSVSCDPLNSIVISTNPRRSQHKVLYAASRNVRHKEYHGYASMLSIFKHFT